MKMRIALIAAGTLALAQTGPAQANHAGASATTGAVGSPAIEPDAATKFAENQPAGTAESTVNVPANHQRVFPERHQRLLPERHQRFVPKGQQRLLPKTAEEWE